MFVMIVKCYVLQVSMQNQIIIVLNVIFAWLNNLKNQDIAISVENVIKQNILITINVFKINLKHVQYVSEILKLQFTVLLHYHVVTQFISIVFKNQLKINIMVINVQFVKNQYISQKIVNNILIIQMNYKINGCMKVMIQIIMYYYYVINVVININKKNRYFKNINVHNVIIIILLYQKLVKLNLIMYFLTIKNLDL